MKNLYLSIVALFLLAFSSCAKESKTTSASMVFWQTQSNADALQSAGVTSLSFYVAGKLIGSQAASMYFDIAPDCSNTTPPHTTLELNGSDQQTVSWKVTDQNGVTVYENTETLKNGDCIQMQLK